MSAGVAGTTFRPNPTYTTLRDVTVRHPGGVGSTGGLGSREFVERRARGGGKGVRSAMEWAQVRAMAADGVSEREIARRLGINRRTVKRLARSYDPPSYERAPTGS